jgi:hypothetical protein
MQQLRQVFASPGEKHTALFNPEKQYAPTTTEQVAHIDVSQNTFRRSQDKILPYCGCLEAETANFLA